MTKRPFLFILLMYTLATFFLSYDARGAIDTTATWTFTTGGSVYSSPTCDNGFVYVGSDDSTMYCLDGTSASLKWKFRTGGFIRCKPAVVDTFVYFESDDGYLYAVNKNPGNKIWSANIGNTKRVQPDPSTFTGNYWDYMQSSPCVDSGVVYVGSGDSSFYAVDGKTGVVKWSVKTGGIIRSSPCVYKDMVYAGSWDGYIYAFNTSDGSLVWKYYTEANGYKNVQPSPRVYNEIIYCGSRSGYFYAIDAYTGELIWKYLFSSSAPWVESSAAIEDGIVYVGSSDVDQVYALDASTGTIRWKCAVPGDTWSSPFYHAGMLYIGLASYGSTAASQNSGALLAIDAAAGQIKWRLNCGTTRFIGGVVSSPTVDGNMIYYGSLDGKVYAVDTAFASPPKWCAADFQTMTTDGKQGFYVPGWASGSIKRCAGAGSGSVLRGTTSISSTLPFFAVQRDSVPLQNGEFRANAISFMFRFPTTVPNNAIVKLFAKHGTRDSIAVIDTIGAQVKKGTWSTLWLSRLDSLNIEGKFDLSLPATVGIVLYFPAPYDTTHWTGGVDLDNLWIYGVSFPAKLLDGVTNINEAPKTFHLNDNYPNPFNPATTIEYQVSTKSYIALHIYDVLGRKVMTLVNGVQQPGSYRVVLDGSHLSSGVYFDKLTSGTSCETKTMVLIK